MATSKKNGEPAVKARNIQSAEGAEHLVTSEGEGVVARSAVYYKIGGREYPMRSSSRCSICTSNHRVEIENALLKGWAAGHIAKLLTQEGVPDITTDRINSHIRHGHMPMDATIQRVAVEQRAIEMGRLIDGGEGTLVDHVSALRAVQQKGFERMVNGEIQPDIGDLLAASRALAAFQSEADADADADYYKQAIARMIEVFEQLLQPEVFQKAIEALRTDPILKAIDSQRKAHGAPLEIEAPVEPDDPAT